MEGGPSIQEAAEESNSSESDLEFEENTGLAHSCFHPRGSCHRFIALFFMCLLGFGSYFCYDNPAALKTDFEKDLNITTTEFTLFYSLYSWPAAVGCFVGGILLDSVFGLRLGTNIYMAITLIGQLFFAVGALFNHIWIMLLGRFLFGVGAEPLAVAQNNYAVAWFKGKELNMVFGLQLSCSRLGSAVNFWVTGSIYQIVNKTYSGYECLGIVLFIASLTCIISMVCSLVLGCMDKRAERILNRSEREQDTTPEVIKLTDITQFPLSFWLTTLVCVSYYVAIFPFIALAQDILHKFDDDSNKIISCIYIISAIVSPVLGYLIDKTGRNLIWITLAIANTILAQSLLTFTMWNPYIGMSLMGVAYSLLASGLWPLVSLVIPEHQLGTAYGICQSSQNLGLAVVSILTGTIKDHYGVFWLEIFFIGCLSVAFISCIILFIVNTAQHGVLNMSPAARDLHQQNLLAAEILEREKLISAGVSSSVTPHDLLEPNSDFHIRNRYLSRIGAPLPSNYDINRKGLAYRVLR